jgi:uncharacterized protein (TIGR02679 family)
MIPSEIAQVLDDAGWQRLLAAARRKLETNSGVLDGAIGLRGPTEVERRVVIGITGRHRPVGVKAVRIELAELDQAVRDACGSSLIEVLVQQGGPLRDRRAERTVEARTRASLLASARTLCPRHTDEPWFTAWLDGLADDGTITRLIRGHETDELIFAARVLDRLPGSGLPLPVLAEQATGNTKALSGTRAASLVLRALALRDAVATPTSRAQARVRWEAAGVIVDDLASQVLVLNIRVTGDHIVARWLRDAADAGIPFRLTLHQLSLAQLAPNAPTIHVCENPAVLRAAAGQLGTSSAPLICTEGQPSAACHTLLTAATGQIHWRGDFDWTGLRTTATAITRYHALPWRMTSKDYSIALEAGDSEPLKGLPAPSPWEPRLAELMSHHRQAIMEERLIPVLLDDLASE